MKRSYGKSLKPNVQQKVQSSSLKFDEKIRVQIDGVGIGIIM